LNRGHIEKPAAKKQALDGRTILLPNRARATGGRALPHLFEDPLSSLPTLNFAFQQLHIDMAGPPSPTPSERARNDKAAKEKEDAEQAALPYKWTQTIQDVDITIAIAANLKGRDLDVKLSKTKLRVAIKGQDPIIDVILPPDTGHV
jgi:hypothetical protein